MDTSLNKKDRIPNLLLLLHKLLTPSLHLSEFLQVSASLNEDTRDANQRRRPN